MNLSKRKDSEIEVEQGTRLLLRCVRHQVGFCSGEIEWFGIDLAVENFLNAIVR